MGSELEIKEILECFGEARKRLGVPRPSAKLDAADEALDELIRKSYKSLLDSARLAPCFADHGPKHACSLARFVLQVFDQADVSKLKETCSGMELHFLVLLFCSFILHDIGMGIIGHRGDLPASGKPRRMTEAKRDAIFYQEVMRNQGVRPDHDKRSLEFIQGLCQDTERMKLPHWQAYWESTDRQVNGWPSPTSKWALFLLLRICQSHGDDKSTYLSSERILEYACQVPSGGTAETIQFAKEWDKSTIESLTRMILAAASLLCFCDLCDIGEGRFMAPSDALLERFLPNDAESRKLSRLPLELGLRPGNG
jgi:hypothetical protein